MLALGKAVCLRHLLPVDEVWEEGSQQREELAKLGSYMLLEAGPGPGRKVVLVAVTHSEAHRRTVENFTPVAEGGLTVKRQRETWTVLGTLSGGTPDCGASFSMLLTLLPPCGNESQGSGCHQAFSVI